MILRKLLSQPTCFASCRGVITHSMSPARGTANRRAPVDRNGRRYDRGYVVGGYMTQGLIVSTARGRRIGRGQHMRGRTFGRRPGSRRGDVSIKRKPLPTPTSCRPPKDLKRQGPEPPASFGLLVPVSDSFPSPQGSLVLAY